MSDPQTTSDTALGIALVIALWIIGAFALYPVLSSPAQAQGVSLPTAGDPYWKTDEGQATIQEIEVINEIVRKGCDEFVDTQHKVTACYRAEMFAYNGETLELYSAEELRTFWIWFGRKKWCLDHFCEAEKKDKCNVCR